jgi:hypothetical protein
MYNYVDIRVTKKYIEKYKKYFIKRNKKLPEWLFFCNEIYKLKWKIFLYKSKYSRYIYIQKYRKGKKRMYTFKIRFSYHKHNEINDIFYGESDFFIGPDSNLTVKELIKNINKIWSN